MRRVIRHHQDTLVLELYVVQSAFFLYYITLHFTFIFSTGNYIIKSRKITPAELVAISRKVDGFSLFLRFYVVNKQKPWNFQVHACNHIAK